MIRPLVSVAAALAGLALSALPSPARAQTYLNAQLPWHDAVLDPQGQVLAWYRPDKSLGYDHVVRIAWDFLEHKLPPDKVTGLPLYLVASVFDGKTLQADPNLQHNPAGTFAHLTDAMLAWYPYSGDRDAIALVRTMLDYQLAHGTTPAGWEWPGVPLTTSCLYDKDYGGCFRDMPMDFRSGIEPDKVGELGLSYVQFYELTGERKYLEAGIHCAMQLARHVRGGDTHHTPWPFRLDAHSGAVIGGEEYGGMTVAPVRLFDELIRLHEGDSASYQRARDLAWNWIRNNPLNRASPAWDKWSGYHEDIPKDTDNVNTIVPMMTAYYILSQADPASVDPGWKEDVGYLLDRSRVLLGQGPYFGAWAINEQLRPDGGMTGDPFLGEQEMRDMAARNPAIKLPEPNDGEIDYGPRVGGALHGTFSRGCCSRAGLVCATAQWGAINALYYASAHDGQAREHAFRALNYATYFVESDGKINAAGGDFGQYWFEDGYGDAGRHFMWAMGAVPDFAPIGEDHLLHSTSVVQRVTYGKEGVAYQTFDKSASEVLRLTYKPSRIESDSNLLSQQQVLGDNSFTVKALPSGDYEVHVRHVGSTRISIRKD